MSTLDTRLPDPPGAVPDLPEASLRPFGRTGRGYRLLAAVLAAVVLNGVVAWSVQLRDGLGVAGYNDEAFWAIYIADVVTFIGVSYGGAVISAILRLTGAAWRAPLTRLAEGTAVVTVLVGGAMIIPHLGRPERIWELVTRPNLSSPIFWDFVAVMTYTAASIVFFALPLVPDMAIARLRHPERLGRRARLYAALSRGWTGTPAQRRVLGGSLGLISIMIIPLAVSVHSVLSWAFSLTSRPWWHESIWAPYFVIAALYSGVALVILVVAVFRRVYHLEAFIGERHFVRLGFILAAFSATYLYLTLADLLPNAYVGERDDAAVFVQLLTGRYAVWFWLFVVAAGLVPLLVVALPWTRNTRGLVIVSAVIVPAMWLKRMLMVLDPANYDRVTGAFGAFHFTWVSVSITLAAAAAVPLLLMLLFRVVPLLSVDEMEQEAAHDLAAARQTVERSGQSGQSGQSGHRGVPPAAGVTLALAGALLWAVASAHPAAAADAAPGRVAITVTGTATGDAVRLTATLTGPGALPLAHAKVQFLQAVTVFGAKAPTVPIGWATTDASGLAVLTYRPTTAGTEHFLAQYGGTAQAPQASAGTDVAVTNATAAYHPAPAKPLAGTGRAFVSLLLLLVAAVWITLAAQLVRVRRACRETAPGPDPGPAVP